MNTCPRCGADLRDGARFCPHCMTPLNEKRVVPTPKYTLRRWLPAAVAVLVFVATLGGGWMAARQMAQENLPVEMPTPQTTAPSTTAPSTTATANADTTTMTEATTLTTTLTTLAEGFPTSMESTATSATTAKKPISYPTYSTIPTAPKTTTGTTASRTTTTTKKTTTTTTAAKPTYPASWDEPAVFYTEDGEIFEDVGWTYVAASDLLLLDRGDGSYHNYIFSETTLHSIPLSQCIVITGFQKIASNGCYRIPPVIDGKVVIAVNMQNPSEAYRFNDAMVAPTVRVITFPPEMIVVYPYTFDQCQNIEHAYFTSAELLMYPSAVPANTGVSYSDSLAMHAYRTRMLYDPYAGEYEILKNYCQYIVNPGVCITNGSRKHYPGTYWWPTDTAFFSQLYPDWFTNEHNER